MTFEQDKERQLSRKDMSSIGSWDPRIRGLCEKLNNKKNYYTTSSCAGRIVLIKLLDKKAEDVFLFRTHEKTSFREIEKALSEIRFEGVVEYKQSTCILHVACKTLEDAQTLVDKAKLAGWKNSGIMTTKKRFIVELHSTENIAFPIMKKRKILVNDEFLKLVIRESNEKLERTWKKIQKLEKLI
jgi:tRNA wybutosine-synthesizing protein 3